ncbi:hypothetical protein [Modestobacter sp. SYSU DS0290]
MQEALAGWLGVTIIGAAVVLVAVLEVLDRAEPETGGRPPGRRAVAWVLQGLLVLLVAAALAATVVRFALFVG